MILRAISQEESEQTYRYQTYLNYLTSISEFIGSVKGDEDRTGTLISPVVESQSFKDIQGGRCSDKEKLGQLLRNAWFTEIQMNLTSQFNELVAYSNHWTPVQLYYATYLVLRAYITAKGQNVSREHASTLKFIGNEIHLRPDLFPEPWRTICVGDPEETKPILENLPKGITIGKISSLSPSHRVSFWDSYAMFLKTTRNRQLDNLCSDWKQAHRRKRVSPKEKEKFIANLPPTTIFHTLYRLRVRSNYSDADSLLLSLQGTQEAVALNVAFLNIGWATLLILELLISRYIGKKLFGQIVENFQKHEIQGYSNELIGIRWKQLQTRF